MANDLDLRTAKCLAPFVEMTFVGGAARYVRWDEDVVVGGNTYGSCPELAVDPIRLHGGSSDAPANVKMRIDRPPLDAMCGGYPAPAVDVVIYEGDPLNVAGTFRPVFSGRVSKTSKNVAGLRKIAQAQVSGPRRRLAYSLGVMANTTCEWTFADDPGPKNCGIRRADVTHAGQVISAVNNDVLTIPTLPAGRWTNGAVTVGGVTLTILSAGAGSAILMRAAPPSWAGATAVLVEGCTKDLDTGCRAWNNESRFGGFGIGIPAYHPMVQNPK